MSNLVRPNPGEYVLFFPSNREVNDYLRERAAFNEIKAQGLANDDNTPELRMRINNQQTDVGVHIIGDHLLCVYVLHDNDEGRLFFALTGSGTGSSKRWTPHNRQLVTLTDGDNDLLKPNGPATILDKVLSEK